MAQSYTRRKAIQAGYRSGLEESIGSELTALKIPYEYEPFAIPYLVQETRKYTPDWVLLKNGILVESKGRFVTADRKKHRLIKEQHPDLDLRFVFSNPHAKIGKKSPTTYAMWCDKMGFKWARLIIPAAWLVEPPNVKSQIAIQRLKESTAQ